MTSHHQGLSLNNKRRQWRESLGTRLEQKEILFYKTENRLPLLVCFKMA